MNSYEIDICGLKRELSLFKVAEDFYIAGIVMFGDVEVTKHAAAELLKRAPEFDVMITAESKGIPLLYEMARQSGNNYYIVARKGPKVYMKDVITTEVESITTQHKQILCIGSEEAEAMHGKRVLVVDDVISTGESLKALETLIDQVGGKIVAKMAVLAEGDAIGRKDLTYLAPLPVFHADGSIIE